MAIVEVAVAVASAITVGLHHTVDAPLRNTGSATDGQYLRVITGDTMTMRKLQETITAGIITDPTAATTAEATAGCLRATVPLGTTDVLHTIGAKDEVVNTAAPEMREHLLPLSHEGVIIMGRILSPLAMVVTMTISASSRKTWLTSGGRSG